jgi:hypothetical protein
MLSEENFEIWEDYVINMIMWLCDYVIKLKVESHQNGEANEIEDLGKSISWDL